MGQKVLTTEKCLKLQSCGGHNYSKNYVCNIERQNLRKLGPKSI